MSQTFSYLEEPLTSSKETSLQQQLLQRIKQGILSGQLPAGKKLPASRQLAEQLHISRNTVLIVYEQLAAEGYIVANQRGTCVTQLSDKNNALPFKTTLTRKVLCAKRLSHLIPTSKSSDRSLPMTVGIPALAQFPIHAWRRAYNKVLEKNVSKSLGYGNPLGEPELREAIAQHLRISRGVRCHASNIVITEGTQESLSLCVKLFTNPGDIVWVEEPGYRGAKTAFSLGDLDIIPIRVDHHGITIANDEVWINHPPRLIQTTPSHQYPTGAVLPLIRRLELIERASQTGAWIIEDDYDSEFRHHGDPIAAMQGLLPDSPVLYLGTFSKTMFPALRLGFLVLPESVAAVLTPSLNEMLRGGHRLEQLALALFIRNGQFSQHLGRMRRLYRERQQALREALSAFLKIEHEILGGNSGLHLTVRLPTEFKDQSIIQDAHQKGINPSALSTFAIAPLPEDNGLVIGYGNTAAERFSPLVKQLNQILRHYSKI